jgi:hypothetical protein
MRFAKSFCLPLVTMVCGMLASSVSAATITDVTPLDPANGSSTIPTATAHATDTVTVTTPVVTNTPFEVTFTAADIPNITGFQLQSNTAYSMFVYNASGDMAMWTLFVGGGVIRSYRNKKARK